MFIGSRMMMKPSATSDPYFADVVLLLHMDGANGGTTFTDSSSSGKIATPTLTTTETSVFKYGTAAGVFNGSSSYLYVPASTDWAFSTGDFTLECWVNPNAVSAQQTLFGNSYSAAFSAKLDGSNLAIWLAGTLYSGSVSVVPGSFQHVAWVRVSGTLTTYVNGVGHLLSSSATNNVASSPNPLGVGINHSNGTEYYGGYIDDLRITKGIARYTGNFTPPTQAFPNQ